MPAALHLYVENSDDTYGRAVKAGGESLYAPQKIWTTATVKAESATPAAINGT